MKPQQFLYCIIIIVIFSACKEIIIEVTGITLDKETLELVPGEKEFLNATVHPIDADKKNVRWESSNTAVATVNNNGFITAIDNGDATITATTQDGEKRANCKVNVDYRNRWVGICEFTTISIERWWPDYIYKIDSTKFVGKISKYNNDKLKIIYLPNATEPDLSSVPMFNGIMYPTVSSSGKLRYPEITFHHGGFNGFISNDTIWLSYSDAFGHFGDKNLHIQGRKINKK